jgi:hypothetical protein
MSAEFRVIEEADGTILIEIETEEMNIVLTVEESDASALFKDLSAVLQDRYYTREETE